MRKLSNFARPLALAFVALLSWSLTGCDTLDSLTTSAADPVINTLTPKGGPTGSTVVIQGANFGTAQGTVAFEDATKANMNAPVTSWTDTMIVVTSPAMPSGNQTLNVGLQTSGGLHPALPATFQVTTTQVN